MNLTLFAGVGIVLFSFACNVNTNPQNPVIVDLPSRSAADTSPANKKITTYEYDLKSPAHSWRLPAQLVEVSGNTWIDKDHLILIEDLHPNLYLVKIDDKNATLEKMIPFANEKKEKTDIEDVAYVNSTVYALWSHGVLYKIDNWQDKPQVKKIKTFLSKENNTEGLCYDPVIQKLLVACKDASNIPDEKKSTKAVYTFDMAKGTLDAQPFMIIHKKDFEDVSDQKLDFFPSAIAVHPITKDIYLLSTKDNKCMAVFSHDGKLKSLQFIDKELMPQPEGICFSPEGILYISSEGKKGEPGNLFEFSIKAK